MKCSLFLEKVRKEKPLVHHLTNWVTIAECAAIVKAFGAAPVMAHAPEEVADMTGIASSLVLNIGTLTSDFIESMKIAALAANKKGIPVTLDVCGAGATAFRDRMSFELLDKAKIDIIKGNASEVARIAGEDVRTKGVEATESDKDLASIAKNLSKKRNAIVVITGKVDIIADKDKIYHVHNGHEMMSNVVGTGCIAASVIGAFAAVSKDLASASAAGLCCLGIAAELAAKESSGPMSFKEKLFDKAFLLDKETVDEMQRVDG